jgi:hypothetical protein
MNLTLAAVIVTVFINWSDPNSTELGTTIYREIAGTYQPVGEVGPNVTTFSETFSAIEGAQLPYKVNIFNETESVFSNEWVGVVPLPPPPCKQKGTSGNCR